MLWFTPLLRILGMVLVCMATALISARPVLKTAASGRVRRTVKPGV